MERLLGCSRRMRYASMNKEQPVVPKKQMKVVIITPSVRIPRNLFRCEMKNGGLTIEPDRDCDDTSYQAKRSWTPPGYTDED